MRAKLRLRWGPKHEANCREVIRVLQSYLDGQTDEVTAQRVARHLDACRRCGLEASVYLDIKASLARRARGVDPSAANRLHSFVKSLAVEGHPPQPPTG